MPSIEEFTKKNSKFKKTKFRPWDYDADLLAGKPKVTKEEPKGNQKVTKEEPKGNQKVTKEEPKGNPKGNQEISEMRLTENYLPNIYKLSGLQKKLFFYFVELTENRGDFKTGPIQIGTLVELTNTTKTTIKTALQRLINKFLILREADKIKMGKGGFRYYSITKEIKAAALEFKRMIDIPIKLKEAKGNQMVTQMVTNGSFSSSSSSSNIYNKTTTTELPEEWLEIDLSPIEDIGFSKHHLVQLYKMGSLMPQTIQDSIEYFSFDLKENNKASEIKTNSLGYFMGILKRSGVYTAPENYEDPKDRAMRIYLERQKAVKKKREAMEKEMLEMAFSEWKGKLSEEEKNNLLPEEIRQIKLSGAKESHLRQYFRETQWTIEREKKLTEVDNLKENKKS